MNGLQQVAGLCIMLMGLVGFLDRDRPVEARRNYYWYDAKVGVAGRAIGSLAAITVGAVLLLLA